jgi:hypothetical protein
MASSFQFRNVNTYVVEPEGEPIQSLPSKGSLDFSPQSSCIEEAPDDGNQYARQSKSWQEVVIPANTSDLNNDSGFITDSSLTKENIVGLKLADSPEFADTQITPLAVEATYTPTVWSYLVGLFTTVPKSVKSHIVKIWERLGLLEDTYILKYVVPVDTTAINLTADRYGNALNLTDITIIADIQYTGPSGMNLRINNIDGELYRNIFLDPYANVKYRDRFYIESTTNFILQKSVIELFILSNEVVLTAQTRAETATPTYLSGARGVSNTVGMNINAITTINIFSFNGANSIKAGSVILIKKR